ncbi:MAG: hypothetical protein U0Q11_18780 [Vicinamibacterales bacterium]
MRSCSTRRVACGVADRGNHHAEIFHDQEGNYLESRWRFSRPSGFFIKGDLLYVIDSEIGAVQSPELA